eukprot:98855-Rhodomonas_salina.1
MCGSQYKSRFKRLRNAKRHAWWSRSTEIHNTIRVSKRKGILPNVNTKTGIPRYNVGSGHPDTRVGILPLLGYSVHTQKGQFLPGKVQFTTCQNGSTLRGHPSYPGTAYPGSSGTQTRVMRNSFLGFRKE